MTKAALSYLAIPDTEIAVRVTPKASRNAVKVENGEIRVYVSVVPESGKANAAVQKLLAKEIGIAKSRLALLRGQQAETRCFGSPFNLASNDRRLLASPAPR